MLIWLSLVFVSTYFLLLNRPFSLVPLSWYMTLRCSIHIQGVAPLRGSPVLHFSNRAHAVRNGPSYYQRRTWQQHEIEMNNVCHFDFVLLMLGFGWLFGAQACMTDSNWCWFPSWEWCWFCVCGCYLNLFVRCSIGANVRIARNGVLSIVSGLKRL